VGVVGDDAAAATLVEAITREHPNIEARFAVARGRPTTNKTRYLGGRHQLIRVDRELPLPSPPDCERQLIEDIEEAIEECDLVVISDYLKGAVTDAVLAAAFAAAAAAGKKVIVDPKRTDFSAYRGATLICPNRGELERATGLPCATDQEAETATAAAIAQSGAAILFKRSQKGVSLFRAGAAAIHMAAEAREVADVSGAGDTVVAGVALGLAAGMPYELAMRIGNAAAGVVVGKVGAAAVTREELDAALRTPGRAATGPVAGGFTPMERALAQRDRWRAEGQVVGFTNGCFDLLHAGHVSLIAQSAAACDRLIVALNSDASVRRLKGAQRPVQDIEARAAVMCGLKGVDMVMAFEEDTPLELIRALAPDVLIKGADYSEEQVVGADLVKARGGRIVLAQLADGQSTTALVAKART
jgi:D-beta-D-heptose 7-phosphate kinase/D-beta-D-heptose 1-phosphate adenosyltransferase